MTGWFPVNTRDILIMPLASVVPNKAKKDAEIVPVGLLPGAEAIT
jgi:hypothetical protein